MWQTVIRTTLIEFLNTAIPVIIQEYAEEKLAEKAMEYERQKFAVVEEQLKTLVAHTLPSVIPDNVNKIEIGFTWCPYCQEEFKKHENEYKAGTFKPYWIDLDKHDLEKVVGVFLADEFDIQKVPAVIDVKKENGKVTLCYEGVCKTYESTY